MPLRFWDNGRHLSVHLTHTDSSKCTICQLGTLETPLHCTPPLSSCVMVRTIADATFSLCLSVSSAVAGLLLFRAESGLCGV
ncbi:hypothetical protein CEXT_439641 [Caerostris extrusa]|uniref:Uncharacterized protein n=1 Tax=Caerostris extrusa TaxID=172846 RepID=A0AAV4N8P2_CAEEX|nr:hypothetical protein CEXT_439641 [Caerostris extrusa]